MGEVGGVGDHKLGQSEGSRKSKGFGVFRCPVQRPTLLGLMKLKKNFHNVQLYSLIRGSRTPLHMTDPPLSPAQGLVSGNPRMLRGSVPFGVLRDLPE